MNIDKSKLPEDVRKYLDEIEKRATAAEAQVEELKKSAGGAQQSQQEPEDIWKGVSAEVRKRMEDLEKRTKEAEEIAKQERDARATREFVAKAAEFKGLAVNADEFGPVLKKLSEAAPAEYAKLADVLKAADKAIVEGGLFKEVGKSSGAAPGSASEQLDAIAKSKVEKSGGKLTYAKAFDEAMRENPNLYRKQKEGN